MSLLTISKSTHVWNKLVVDLIPEELITVGITWTPAAMMKGAFACAHRRAVQQAKPFSFSIQVFMCYQGVLISLQIM